MDELSAVNEIADDITLVVWLLNRYGPYCTSLVN